VIVIGRTFQEHLLNLRKVFQRFRKAHIKLNPEKCQHIVSPEGGITTGPGKLKAVREWPTPKNKHEIKSFLGLCSYYRRFISGLANIAKPLTKLTKEKQAQAAYQTLNKGDPLYCPLFLLTRSQERGSSLTDASDVGIGGVLSQVQDGKERAIAYCSKTLYKVERNDCVIRRELHREDAGTFP
jgi:hypothetical protein